MNRRERRSYEKRMGLLKYKSKLNFKEYNSVVTKNIQTGLQTTREHLYRSKVQENHNEDEITSQKIYDKALEISRDENISFVDAMDLARKELVGDRFEESNDVTEIKSIDSIINPDIPITNQNNAMADGLITGQIGNTGMVDEIFAKNKRK